MKQNMLRDVIQKCHDHGIKVITRFDFSRAHESIFKAHPDWFYLSPKGERIINSDMYVVSIDAPYEQQVLFEIVEEVINTFPIDGIFINMPGNIKPEIRMKVCITVSIKMNTAKRDSQNLARE